MAHGSGPPDHWLALKIDHLSSTQVLGLLNQAASQGYDSVAAGPVRCSDGEFIFVGGYY